MRLIDAGEVKNSLLIELLSGVDGGTDASYLKTYEVIDRIENIVNEWVDNQATIEAIPVKWIEKWVRNDPTADPDTFTDMVADWRKENERI